MNHFRIMKLPVAVCLAAIVVLGGCHKKAVAPPPPPPPPPAPAPTASISATPSVINQGQYAMLQWTTTNAASASISGIGTVAVNGSQSVYPSASTTYTLTARGAGGSAEATARVTVNPPPPPPPPAPAPAPPSLTEEQLFEQNVHDIFFDYDKADIRPQDATVAQQDGAYLASHPDMKIVIGGHCDERGSAEYNIALGQRRAESLQKALTAAGVPSSSIRIVSYGKEKPFCTESNEQCWQQNRRDHLVLDR
ncbi:MAG: peptidoglycan-associated lipoprotein Pal [Acidobacteriaceae bacterium]